MSKHIEKQLFSEFPALTKAQWRAAIVKDLKGESFEEKLVWKSAEGFDIQPFYMAEDMEQLGSHLWQLGAGRERKWENRQLVEVSDAKAANRAALDALNTGANGILFKFSNKEVIDFEQLIKGILLEHCQVCFWIEDGALDFVRQYRQYLSFIGQNKNTVQGSLYVAQGYTPTVFVELMSEIADLPAFRLGIAVAQNEAVSTQIADLLACIDLYMNELSSKNLLNSLRITQLEFSWHLGNQYFLELSGLRALRFLLHRFFAAYGVESSSEAIVILAQTHLEDGQTDENQYLISNTTQAMSAILGGCTALVVVPHLSGEKRAFAERIARNISTILAEEAHFDKIADAAAGAFFLENLTEKIAERAWEIFRSRL